MTTIPETASIAGLAVIVFIILPAMAWILALVASSLAWRSLTSRPLDAPPRTRPGMVRQLYAMVVLDPVLFGFVLWILTAPVTEALQAGGPSDAVGAGVRLFVSAGIVYALTSFIVAATQARIYSRRIRDLIGAFSARALSLVVIPTLAIVSALLAGFLTLRFTVSFLAGPLPAAAADPWVFAWIVFGICGLAVPVMAELALRQDLATRSGFLRAASLSLLGVIPVLGTLGGFLVLASGS